MRPARPAKPPPGWPKPAPPGTPRSPCGSRNDDAAWLAARVWTVTATAEMAGLNVLTYLTAYLDACGRNRGKPLAGPELHRFFPWAADPPTCAPGHGRPGPGHGRPGPERRPPRRRRYRQPAVLWQQVELTAAE
jgi:hypothetical protein